MTSKRSDRVIEYTTVEGLLLHQTPKAVLVAHGSTELWIPKSEAEILQTKDDGTIVIKFPKWVYDSKQRKLRERRKVQYEGRLREANIKREQIRQQYMRIK